MKIAIVVFSGTGNTKYVTNLLSKELQLQELIVETITLGLKEEDKVAIQNFKANIASYDLLGIGFPILGLNAPSNVLEFVQTLPFGCNKVFIFSTAADNHEINHLAFDDLSKLLIEKGYIVFHNFLYLMPSNFMVSYPEALNLQIIDTIKSKVLFHANELLQSKHRRLSICWIWKLIAKTIHFLENRWGRQQFGKSLYTNSKCTLCYHCLHNCPSENISQNGNTVEFDTKCIFCMRCIYECPQKAIQSNKYNWCIIKEGYSLKNILNIKSKSRTFVTEHSRGFWKHFYNYFYK